MTIKKISKQNSIYLDFAAATPVDATVFSKMAPFWENEFGNAHSLHKKGVNAEYALSDARKKIAQNLSARPQEIIFTSGTTESNNLAILGTVAQWQKNNKGNKNRPHIITTVLEHSAVLGPVKELEQQGCEITIIPVDESGIVDPKEIKKAIKKNTILISVIYANNVIGTVQPIKEIAKEIRHFKKMNATRQTLHDTQYPLFHTDAAQAINYLNINVLQLGVDMMSFGGAKIYGPKGIGILYKKSNVDISPITFGGGHEYGLRPGTEALPLIVGISEALEISSKMKEREVKRLIAIRDYFIKNLLKDFSNIKLNGDAINRLPNNVHISVSGIDSEVLVLELDAKGIYASSRSACKSGEEEDLLSTFISTENNTGQLRFSLGRTTTKKDIIYTLKILKQIIKKYDKVKMFL